MSDDGHEEEDADWVEALSHRPPYDDLQEDALISPEALLALQADLLCDPHGIPLRDTGKRPPNEDGATHDEMVAYAATRVRRLLAACRDEKWHRLKTSPCREAIAKTPLPQIAKLTLALIRGRHMPLSEAVNAALTHVEVEDYVRVEMALGGSHKEGIEKFRIAKQAHQDHLEQFAKKPEVERSRDEHGNVLPQPFEEGLEVLFPLPGWKGTRRRHEQLRRFTDFLIGITRDEHPKVLAVEEERERFEEERLKRLKERSIKVGQHVSKEQRSKPPSEEEKWHLLSDEEQGQIRAEAGNRLKKMRRTGIPPVMFQAAIIWVRLLFDEHVVKARTEASEKGHRAKKRRRRRHG